MISTLRLILMCFLSLLSTQTWSYSSVTLPFYFYDTGEYLNLDRGAESTTQETSYVGEPDFPKLADELQAEFTGIKTRMEAFIASVDGFVVTKGALARGRAAEQRVLNDLGLSKNTQKVRTGEGASIPDALTKRQSIEIKDCIGVSCTKQIRIQTEAARNSGRQSTLITGDKTHVSGPAQRAFDNIIRRPDLGPQ